MKSRSKSTKASLTLENKKPKSKQIEPKQAKSVSKKSEMEIRANLENAFKLLQSRLNIKTTPNSSTIMTLSASLYQVLHENIPERPKVSAGPTFHSFNNSGISIPKDKNLSHQIPPKRVQSNHSSSLMEYFKQKFGSPVKDEEAAQRKLKALQVLKRSQELVSRCSSQFNSSLHSGCDIGGKDVVIGKIKQKKRK